MACKCKDKQNAPEPEIQPTVNIPFTRLAIYCAGCGVSRLIPSGLKIDDIFTLVPCPRCGVGLRGRLVDGGVEEVTNE